MIPVPSPPTDNLYKFTAITGLIAAGFGFIAPTYLASVDLETFVERRIEIDKRTTDSIIRVGEVLQKDPTAPADLPGKVENFKRDIEHRLDAERELFEAEVKSRREILDSRLKGLRWASWIGLGVAVVGFGLWMWQVQWPQDRILWRKYRRFKALGTARPDQIGERQKASARPRKVK